MIWCVVGCLFLGLGLYAWFSKKARALGFWANAEMFEVTDVKKYNRAMARLFWAFGVVMIGLGIPLLGGENSAWILVSVAGLMGERIGAMVVYCLVIERKYRRR